MWHYRLFVILTLSVCVVHCGKAQSTQSTAGAKTIASPTDPNTPNATTAEGAKLAAAIQGTWDSGCISEGFQNGESQRVVDTYSGADFSTVVQLFSDSVCKTVDSTSRNVGKFKIGAPSQVKSDAYEFDSTTTSLQITFHSNASLQTFKSDFTSNTKPECRAVADKVEIDKPTDLSACVPLPQHYSLIKMTGQELHFGLCTTQESTSCNSPDHRPSYIDAEMYVRTK